MWAELYLISKESTSAAQKVKIYLRLGLQMNNLYKWNIVIKLTNWEYMHGHDGQRSEKRGNKGKVSEGIIRCICCSRSLKGLQELIEAFIDVFQFLLTSVSQSRSIKGRTYIVSQIVLEWLPSSDSYKSATGCFFAFLFSISPLPRCLCSL